ncbi:TPA: threonylcarbamoyl-AMP synthase [Candidatus Woesearchaeota archaeon]|nr:threonylcarbamoyl-AMP synthase [Candidatus Woesearchaeota archaeon]
MTRRGATKDDIARAARIIRDGGIVAFPTETIYGLGANALNSSAVGKIFSAKGRPADNPLIVHIADIDMLDDITASVPPAARALMARFWPGPLTILFERSPLLPMIVTAGLPTVAVRIPDHPMALALIKESGCPIAAPSANRSGSPSPTTAAHVRDDFPDITILDGGHTLHGVESTVVDVRGRNPTVLRLGAITLEELRRELPGIKKASSSSKRPASPGMKYRHYAPERPLHIFDDAASLVRYAKRCSQPIILCLSEHKSAFKGYDVIDLGSTVDDAAHNLFAALRTKRKGDCILALAVPKRGKGLAVMDRLERAANGS